MRHRRVPPPSPSGIVIIYPHSTKSNKLTLFNIITSFALPKHIFLYLYYAIHLVIWWVVNERYVTKMKWIKCVPTLDALIKLCSHRHELIHCSLDPPDWFSAFWDMPMCPCAHARMSNSWTVVSNHHSPIFFFFFFATCWGGFAVVSCQHHTFYMFWCFRHVSITSCMSDACVCACVYLYECFLAPTIE